MAMVDNDAPLNEFANLPPVSGVVLLMALSRMDQRTGSKVKAILSDGRKKGTESSKKKAEDNKKLMLKINADLLRHPDTARWTISERADHILKRNFKMVNGNPYSKRRIEDIITGT